MTEKQSKINPVLTGSKNPDIVKNQYPMILASENT